MERNAPPSEIAGTEPGNLDSAHADPSRARVRRRVSPSLFGTIVLCFFLPLLTVKCYGNATVTGVQAATGVSLPGSDPAVLDRFRDDTSVPNPLVAIALASAIAGLGFGFVKGRIGLRASLAAGLIGASALTGFVVWAAAKTNGEIILRPGLLAVPLFIAAAVWNTVRLVQLHRGARAQPP